MIRLYGRLGNFMRMIGDSQAISMVRRGEAREVYERRHGRPKLFVGVKLFDPTSTNSEESATALTKSDSLAISGLLGESDTHHLSEYSKELRQDRIRAAKNKIVDLDDFVELSIRRLECWPEIGDTKAVRVGPAAEAHA